jgi:hypothetical protein
MANRQMDDAFAIVRTDDSELELAEIARLIAAPLDVTVVDLAQSLSQRFGILAENVSEPVASRCVALLLEAGVAVRAVPQSAIVEPPGPVLLRAGRPDDEVFFYVGPTQKGVVKWSDVLWVDLASVQEASPQEFADWELTGGDGRATRRVRNHRIMVTRQPLFLDVVTRELLLRISQERFEFAATGLPLFPTARENLLALAATIASRATEAHLGPGLSWLGSDSPPREHRAQTEATYRGFLRWQLTRFALA